MSGAARPLALAAVIATLALCATPATASAGVGATVCGLAGWFSGLAGKVCTVASHAGGVLNAGKKLAGGHLGGAIGALTGGASKTAARLAGATALAVGVIGGAQWALKHTVDAIGASTNPDLGAVWFSASYWRMAAVAALLTVPFLFAAAIQAMLRSDLALLLRAAFGYLPLGLLAVGVAAPITGLLLAGSDEMSSIVSSASGRSGASFLGHVGGLSVVVSGASGSLFVSFFIALFTIAAALTLWLELLIRQAAVYVIVLMLPLFFAAMVWPARRIWAVRAVELLVALILSKFAIVAVLGLGGAALGHTLIPGAESLLAGTTLVLLAAFSPWAVLRLLPLHELAAAAVGGLRPQAGPPPRMAESRSHAATDAAEDAAAGTGSGEGAASEDVAAGLPARLRASAPRDASDGGDAPMRDGGAGAPDHATDGAPSAGAAGAPGAVPGGEPSAPPGAGPSAAPGAPPAPAAAAAAEPSQGPAEVPVVEADAFGPVARHGDLPTEIQNMSPDANVLALDQPFVVDAEPLVLPDAPAPPEPEDGTE